MSKKIAANWLIILLFVLGLGIRLYDVTDEPLEIQPARQLRAAIITRAIYLTGHTDAPQDQVDFASSLAADTGLIELSIQEWITAQLYKLAGGEKTWLGRIVAITFWMLGGLALFLLAKDISSYAGGVASVSFYMILPFAVRFSRVLLPDPMMVAGTVLSIWALYNWEKHRVMKWAIAAGGLTGFTILSKSVSGFVLLFPFAFFILSSFDFKEALKDKQIWTIGALAALPSIAYYYYGLVIDGRLGDQFSGRFFSDLLIDPGFYVRWFNKIEFQFSLVSVAFAALGLTLIKNKNVKLLVAGWWVGYFAMGLVFPYHIWTHIYYHLPLVPIIALSLAPAAALLWEKIEQHGDKLFNYSVVFFSLALIFGYHLWTSRVEMAADDYRNVQPFWEFVASEFDDYPDSKIISLTADYGNSLSFYGGLKTTNWRRTGDLELSQLDGIEITFEELWEDTADTDFFLVTASNEFDKQIELKEKLSEYPIFAEGGGYVIYDLR